MENQTLTTDQKIEAFRAAHIESYNKAKLEFDQFMAKISRPMTEAEQKKHEEELFSAAVLNIEDHQLSFEGHNGDLYSQIADTHKNQAVIIELKTLEDAQEYQRVCDNLIKAQGWDTEEMGKLNLEKAVEDGVQRFSCSQQELLDFDEHDTKTIFLSTRKNLKLGRILFVARKTKNMKLKYISRITYSAIFDVLFEDLIGAGYQNMVQLYNDLQEDSLQKIDISDEITAIRF